MFRSLFLLDENERVYVPVGDIDASVKETVKVRKKGSKWWILRKKDEDYVSVEPIATHKAVKVKNNSAPAVPPKSEVVVYSAAKMREGKKADDRPTPARSRSDGASLSVLEKPLPPPRTETTMDSKKSLFPPSRTTANSLFSR